MGTKHASPIYQAGLKDVWFTVSYQASFQTVTPIRKERDTGWNCSIKCVKVKGWLNPLLKHLTLVGESTAYLRKWPLL